MQNDSIKFGEIISPFCAVKQNRCADFFLLKVLKLKTMKTHLRAINCILIIALSCFFQFVKGQIVYTDVNPDQTYSIGHYNLDLNNDGTNDFTLTRTSSVVVHPCPCGIGAKITGSTTIKITPVGITEIGLFAGSSKLDKAH
jgi:hypothetical protein